MEGFYNTHGDTMDYSLHKLILGNKIRLIFNLLFNFLNYLKKFSKLLAQKKHKISLRLIFLITSIAMLVARIYD